MIYWNASLKLNGGSLEAGLPFEELFGTIASEGRYEGTHIGAIVGNIWLDKATVGKQPLSLMRRIRNIASCSSGSAVHSIRRTSTWLR